MKSLLKLRSGRIRICDQYNVSATDMLAAARQQQLEGVVAKRRDGLYEPGKRSGGWVKNRVNRGQEFVIRSEEHTSELQSRLHLVCRLLLEKKNTDLTGMTGSKSTPPSGMRHNASSQWSQIDCCQLSTLIPTARPRCLSPHRPLARITAMLR